MITTADLKSQTKADLTAMAKRLGLAVASSMRKDELVAALAKAQKPASAAKNGVGKKGQAKLKAQSDKSSSTAQSARNKKSQATASGESPQRKLARKKPASKSSGGRAVVDAGAEKDTVRKASGGKTEKARKSGKAPGKTAKASAAKSHSPARDSKASASGARAADKQTGVTKGSTRAAQSPSKRAAQPAKPKRPVEKPPVAKKSNTNPRVLKKIRELQLQKEASKDIAFRPTLVRPPGAAEPIWEKEPQKDRVALFVRDAYWMHAAWDITRSAIERSKAALSEQWHGAKPILRILRLDEAEGNSETVERDIEIHGGLRNWYIEWNGDSARVRVLVGYLALSGRFHVIAKSNIVRTPQAGATDSVDEHWADSGADSERIFSLSGGYDGEQETGEMKEMLEARIHREMGAPALTRLGAGAGADAPFRRRGDFHFDMEIELVVYGSTTPDGYLTLSGEPVALRPDGTFVMRMPFPDKRQVLPAVACSRDGGQQRTIVVAVERNTKIMEPLACEVDSDD